MANYPAIPYRNPFRAVGGVTWAGGSNTGVIGALQHPDQFQKAEAQNLADYHAGFSPLRHPFATNGGFQARMGGGGSGGGDGMIHGYSGGLPSTAEFSQLMGRGPTASDVEAMNGGGLSAPHNQMGSLSQYYGWLNQPSQWQQLQMAGGMPTTPPSPVAHRIPLTSDNADNIPPNSMMAADGGNIPAGQPVVVGERGPELMVPQSPVRVMPNSYLTKLLSGDINSYLMRFL